MVEDSDWGANVRAARRLHDLALDYAAQSHASAAGLIRAFEADALALALDVGDLVVNDDDDERLVLTAQGRFAGQVLGDDPAAGWQILDSADAIAEHYDPADLFADVADALAEALAGFDDEDEPAETQGDAPAARRYEAPMTAVPEAPFVAHAASYKTEAHAAEESPLAEESATLRSLKHLHAAGILTDAEFEAKKTELRQ